MLARSQRSVNLRFKRPADKVNHIYAHLITLSDEKSGTMLLKGLKNEFCRK